VHFASINEPMHLINYSIPSTTLRANFSSSVREIVGFAAALLLFKLIVFESSALPVTGATTCITDDGL